MWLIEVCFIAFAIATISTQPFNGTVSQNGTITNVTHAIDVHHVHHHNKTNLTVPMPFDSANSLPPLATVPTQLPAVTLPVPYNPRNGTNSTTPPMSGIPLYKHPHYDAAGKPVWFPRIIGGTPATLGEFPSKVSLQTSQTSAHFCGGTLLTLRHVLTAAHCITDIQGVPMVATKIQAMADDLNVIPSMNSATRQVRLAMSLNIHEKYNPSSLANDIAIVKLVNEFTKTNTLYPSKRISSAPSAGQLCSLAGWGVVAENSQNISPSLQRVNLEVVSFEQCNAAFQGALVRGMMCASAPGRDACQGDSGGALICQNRVAGVVSFGSGCAHPTIPGVYMDVTHFEKWIGKALNGAPSWAQRGTMLSLVVALVVMAKGFLV
ncbi:trypsin beta-like [Armigeres subalbatus]|uniref:trypsin beta-like n=1 Tax=Armigeres subalbatus TaxID=124917 RepID=UPI002ED3F265